MTTNSDNTDDNLNKESASLMDITRPATIPILLATLGGGSAYLNSLFFSGRLIAVFCLVAIMACAIFVLNLRPRDNTFTLREFKKVLFKLIGLEVAVFVLYVIAAHLYYGETDKPIEQLNGIYLGETYTLSDFKKAGMTVYEGISTDKYAFHLIDNEKPTMHTYVYLNDKQEAVKVTVSYGAMEAAYPSDAEEKLRALALAQYGGKPTFREGYLFDGKNLLSTYHGHDYAGITIYPTNNPDDQETKAKRELLSIELRAMDAVQGQ